MSTVEEHYAEAERLVEQATRYEAERINQAVSDQRPGDIQFGLTTQANMIAAAQVHATLATAYPAAVRADDPPAPEAPAGYFVAPDAHEELCVWADFGSTPNLVLTRRGIPDDLWAHITRGLEVRP